MKITSTHLVTASLGFATLGFLTGLGEMLNAFELVRVSLFGMSMLLSIAAFATPGFVLLIAALILGWREDTYKDQAS